MKTERIKQFEKFVEKELLPSAGELEQLSDSKRKHVQKLVYTNLVDRFDFMVDKTILENCRDESLVEKAFQKNDQPVTESDLINLLLNSSDLNNALDLRLQEKLRLSVLRDRHSRKLHTLLGICSDTGEFNKHPRINPSTGDIVDKFKIQIKTTPHSICGFADYLYSRRNAIIHGGAGSKFLENDAKQIKKYYGTTITKTYKISVSSIKIAAKFYVNVCELIKTSG